MQYFLAMIIGRLHEYWNCTSELNSRNVIKLRFFVVCGSGFSHELVVKATPTAILNFINLMTFTRSVGTIKN